MNLTTPPRKTSFWQALKAMVKGPQLDWSTHNTDMKHAIIIQTIVGFACAILLIHTAPIWAESLLAGAIFTILILVTVLLMIRAGALLYYTSLYKQQHTKEDTEDDDETR